MYSRFFGRKYNEIFLRYREVLDPYCRAFPGSNQLLLPKAGVPQPNYYSMDLNAPSAYLDLRKLYCSIGLPLNSVSMLQMYDNICRPTTRSVARRRFLTALHSGKMAPISAIQNSNFLSCSHHSKNLFQLEQFAQEHFGVICFFNRLGLNVAQQVQAIRTIWRAVRLHGLHIIGLLEDQNNEIIRNATEFSEGLIDRLIENFRKNNSENKLIEPVDISGFPRSHQVLELVSFQQLAEEGQKQRHCVGGYSDAVKSGRCRIFHLEYLGTSTTLQILKNGCCGEHRARFNNAPPPEHSTLASELSEYIRNQNSDTDAEYKYVQDLMDSIPYHGDDYDEFEAN